MVDNVNGVGPVGGPGSSRRAGRAYHEPKETRGADEAQLSGEALRLSKIEGIRLDKVMEVRKALRDGTYVTDEKLNQAMDRLIDEYMESDDVDDV